jgi:serine/threonine protein kinase
MMFEINPSRDQEPCSLCGVILDVGPEAIFSLVRCPRCYQEVRVKSRLGPYQLEEVLGQGGSSRVFRARKEGAHADVALKVLEKKLPNYEEHLRLLRNEALLASLAAHPRVVKVQALEEDGDVALLEMELMAGGSLHDKIVSEEELAEEDVLRIGLQILKALASAQEKGITHGDLKPANILLTAEGGAKLGDFGLAHGSAARPVPQAHLLATPDYVSPEILTGSQGDSLSDLYSLGGCLFHALAGAPPYETEGLTTEGIQALKAKAVLLPEKVCSERTRALVARMMEPESARRFSSYEEVERELLSVLESLDGLNKNRKIKRSDGFFGSVFRHLRGSGK